MMARRFICYLVAACTLLLAACAGRSALSPARRSPPPTTEWVFDECVCPCMASIEVDAWVDRDRDGERGPEESPLPGVMFRVEWHTLACETGGTSQKRVVPMVSDPSGHAEVDVKGCTCDDAEVYAEAPSGYELTTPDHCQGGCGFGFARRSAETGAD